MEVVDLARNFAALADSELVRRTRKGDAAAYGELWSRHASAGRAVAASMTSTFDPDDLVSESFTKVFKAILDGGGPENGFRPYLFATIRNTAAGWGRGLKEVPIDNAETIEDLRFSEENTLAALDRSLTAKAFRTLPTRWQEALWYSEIEQMSPREVAPLLGLKPNSVAALTYRAREGLRQAWIQAHIASTAVDSEHRWTIERLGAHARKKLGLRDAERLEGHLEECAKCAIVAEETEEVGSRLGLILLPLIAGVAGATGYSAWVQHGGNSGVYALGVGGVGGGVAAMPTSVTAGAGAAHAGSGLSATVVVASLVATAVVIAGAATAATLSFSPSDATVVAPHPSSSGSSPKPPASTVTPVPASAPAPVPAQVPVPVAAPVRAPVVAVIRTTPAVQVPTVVTAPVPSAPVTVPPTPAVPPVVVEPPIITSVDLGDADEYFPIVSGTAEPGATVTVSDGVSAPVEVTAASDGTWSTALLTGFAAGRGSVTATQTDKAGDTSQATAAQAFTLEAPAVVFANVRAGILHVSVSGIASASVDVLVDGAVVDCGPTVLNSRGWLVARCGLTTPGSHVISARYSDGTRFGPSSSGSGQVQVSVQSPDVAGGGDGDIPAS